MGIVIMIVIVGGVILTLPIAWNVYKNTRHVEPDTDTIPLGYTMV